MAMICGLEECPCTKVPVCKQHGDCAKCVENHLIPGKTPLPWCERAENQERMKELLAAHGK